MALALVSMRPCMLVRYSLVLADEMGRKQDPNPDPYPKLTLPLNWPQQLHKPNINPIHNRLNIPNPKTNP